VLKSRILLNPILFASFGSSQLYLFYVLMSLIPVGCEFRTTEYCVALQSDVAFNRWPLDCPSTRLVRRQLYVAPRPSLIR
jgi:hypothetical protein